MYITYKPINIFMNSINNTMCLFNMILYAYNALKRYSLLIKYLLNKKKSIYYNNNNNNNNFNIDNNNNNNNNNFNTYIFWFLFL